MSHRPCSWPRCPNFTRRGSGRCHVHRYADRDARDREPPAHALAGRDAAVDALRAAFGEALRIDATAFVSGACSLDVRRDGAVAVIQSYPPDDGWRISFEPAEYGAATTHIHVPGSIVEVVDVLRARWTSAHPPPADPVPSTGT